MTANDRRYDYGTCEACHRQAQNIDMGTYPGRSTFEGHRVCGFCLRSGIGLTFDQLRATEWAKRGREASQ